MTKKRHAPRWRLILALVLTWTFAAHANTEEVVTSRINGGNSFLVVYPDSTGNSTREPGIYVRGGGTGEWIPAIKGTVVSPPKWGGFSLQLNMSQLTSRSECLALVDEHLTVFSINSRSDKAGSVLTLGGKSGVQARDPMDGSEIQIPTLKNLEGASFYSRMIEIEGRSVEVVLISLKIESAMGKGMTLAVILGASDNKGEIIQLPYDPILLDWNYADAEQLSKLILLKTANAAIVGLSAGNILSRLGRALPNDNSVIADWRKNVREAQAGNWKAGIPSTFRPSYPLVDLRTGRLEIEKLPEVLYSNSYFNAVAVYDPVTSQHKLVAPNKSVSLTEVEGVPGFIAGAVQCDDKLCLSIKMYQAVKLTHDSQVHFIRMRDGRVFIAGTLQSVGGQFPSTVQLLPPGGPSAQPPVQISWHPLENGLILTSWKFKDGTARTGIYKLDSTFGFLRLVSQLQLGTEFYTDEQLKWRVQAYQVRNAKLIVFDAFTENVDEKSKYDALFDKKHPTIDVERSLEDKAIRYFYPEPRSVTRLGKVEFLEFEGVPGVPRPDGFFPAGDRSKPLVTGELLPPEIEGRERFTLYSSEIEFKEQKINVFPVAVDYQFKRGASARVALVLSPVDGNAPPAVLPISEPFQIQHLKSVFLLKESKKRGKQKNNDVYVYAFAILENGTFFYSIPINRVDEQSGVGTGQVQSIKLADTPLTASEIQSRMRFSEGHPYWVMTPELADYDRQYSVKSLRNGVAVLPNKDSSKKIRFDDVDDTLFGGRKFDHWRVYPGEKRLAEVISRVRNASEYQVDVFPDLTDLLDSQADPLRPARHVVLIVPADLKKYVDEYPYAYLAREERPHYWSIKNHELQLYLFDTNKANQVEVLDSLDSMRDDARDRSRRPFLWGNLETVQKIGRPKIEEVNGGFYLTERAIGGVGINTQTAESEEKEAPHLLYLLATEGKRQALTEFDATQRPTFTTLLVGTKEEWEALKQQATLEGKRKLFDHYEVVELSQSTQEVRRNLVFKLLHRREFQDLGYRFDVSDIVRDRPADSIGAEEAEQILVHHLVNRVDSLCRSSHVPEFIGFMRVMHELSTSLSTDPSLRRKQIINRGVLEAVLAKVFPVPLNLALLDPEDPLRRLAQPDFALRWQQSGAYDGPILIKQQVVNTLLNQLASDSIRSMPGSMIIHGRTGTGKTSLVLSLFRMLDLKPYNFENPDRSPDAQSFFLQMNRVYEDGKDKPSGDAVSGMQGMMSVSQALGHLDKFLTGPNGGRGFICLDDFHLAPAAVRGLFIQKIRSLIENPFYSVQGKQIPVRNLSLLLTMNLTEDQKKLDQYKDPILATLNDDKTTIESSLLARFGLILNLDTFPASAKGPALLRKIGESAKSEFMNDGRYILVAPDAIAALVGRFPDVNARSFLAAGSRALTHIEPSDAHRFYIVIPRSIYDPDLLDGGRSPVRRSSGGQEDEAAIEAYSRLGVQRVPVMSSALGKMLFLNFVLNNFRRRAFELLLRSVAEDPRYYGQRALQQDHIAPLARAMNDHLVTVPQFPLDALNLTYSEFAAEASQRTEFKGAMAELKRQQALDPRQHKLPLVGIPSAPNLLEAILAGGSKEAEETKQHVLKRHMEKLQKICEKILSGWFHIPSIDQWPPPEQWLQSLPAGEVALPASIATELSDDVFEYLDDIFRVQLASLRDEKGKLSKYDALRFLMMAFDQAIGGLPWARIDMQLLGAIKVATGNLMYGQSPGVQRLLFDGKYSPLIAVDPTFVLDLARNQPFFGEFKDDLRLVPRHERFVSNCILLLAHPEAAGGNQ